MVSPSIPSDTCTCMQVQVIEGPLAPHKGIRVLIQADGLRLPEA
jgi:hypothetical protein